MPAVDRQQAHRLLLELLDLPPEERAAALEASSDDDALRAAVLRLLRAAEAPDIPVDPDGDRNRRLWTGYAAAEAAREAPMAEGARLGPYRILEEIDRGGMAVVYRAERVDGEVTREVAVKVLKLGLDTEEVIRRFEQERQILADLDHPNIARLYDAGHTEDGRPYFVMELVAGVPIDRYCDEHRLSVGERLELFCAVAETVDYAHRNLVVHRDLKPSNILVTEGGASGRRVGHEGPAPPAEVGASARGAAQVKLLDFGIARLLDVEGGDGGRAAPTRALVRMMTPEYASPEQVRGERVTMASDVYQLGVLLYELLAGRRPYVPAGGGITALERAICEGTPARPSAAISRGGGEIEAGLREQAGPAEDAGGAAEAICRSRRTTPARLRRRLRGDLDNIVLQALRKEPERRYRTADRLAQDIRRHLEGLPVSARADTWSYRGRKFLARHALGAAAAAAMLVLVTGLTAYYLARIQSERDQAQAERDRAQAEATKAEQMNQFLTGLFRAADPHELGGTNVTARELLDRGAERVDGELSAQPEAQADMLRALGRTYKELGVYDRAERLLTRAMDLRQRRLGREHPDVAHVLRDLSALRYDEGKYSQALEHVEEAVRIFEGSLGPHALEVANALQLMASTLYRLGEYQEALAGFERVLAIRERARAEDPVEDGRILNNMAILLGGMGDSDGARQLFERALAIHERELGEDHPLVANSLMNLASTQAILGETEGVEAMYRRVLDIYERKFGTDHVSVGMALNNLGDLLVRLERPDEAVEVVERALEIHARAAGPDHPEAAYALATLADAHRAAGRLRDARDALRRGVTVHDATQAATGFDRLLAHLLSRLGRIEGELGDGAAAERNLSRALEIWNRAPESIEPQLAPALVDIGRWLVEGGRCGEAVPLLRRGARLELPPRSPWSAEVAELRTLLAECGAAGAEPRATVTAVTSQQRVEEKRAVPRGARE